MEFKKPKSKKNPPPKSKCSFPLPNCQRVGVFNGFNVTIFDWDSMNDVYFSGNFGKGSLSKSVPTYHLKRDDIPKIMYEQQFANHSKWEGFIVNSETYPSKCLAQMTSNIKLSHETIDNFLQSSFTCDDRESWKSWKKKFNKPLEKECKNTKDSMKSFQFSTDESDKVDEYLSGVVEKILQTKKGIQWKTKPTTLDEEVVVVNLKSNEAITCLENIKPTLKKKPIIIEENLKLNLEESFFLKYVIGSLKIVDINYSELSVSECWEKFTASQDNFLQRYSIYHYYRAKGWVVRSGLKFGGDYLLYKEGPAYYHGSYLVKVLDGRKKPTWRDFIAGNRLVETFNKDLVYCDVKAPENESNKETVFPNALKNYCVQEVMIRRWFPSKERFSKGDSD